MNDKEKRAYHKQLRQCLENDLVERKKKDPNQGNQGGKGKEEHKRIVNAVIAHLKEQSLSDD